MIGGWHLLDASNPKQIHHLAMVASASVRYQSRNRWMAPFGCYRAIGGWHLSDASNPKQIHHLAMVATASVRYQSRNR
jgi:hypothetical protein